MYERLLDKTVIPDETEIADLLGPQSLERLAALEDRLRNRYNLSRELKFPFGSNYGWGYKYSHGSFHLCYVFFESSLTKNSGSSIRLSPNNKKEELSMTSTVEYIKPIADEDRHIPVPSQLTAEESGIFDCNRDRYTQGDQHILRDR